MAEATSELFDLITRGDPAALQAALEAGADANAADRWGVTALGHAAARGDVAALRVLLDRDADPNKTSEAGNSALMAAAARGHLEAMTTLLDRGADPRHRNKWDLGAADWAEWPANAAEVIALLDSRGQ
jgi:ankyrin repeat protein